MSEKQKNKLPNGEYRAFIDSDLKNGSMEIMHANLKGKNKNEIFFSSYVCHPSMANNELSGPVLLNALIKYIEEFYPKPNYTYRFVLSPETIGSIAYLSKFKETMKKNIICGFNLSCVGDNRAYSLIHSPSEITLADQALKSALIGKKNIKYYSFLERGSDERQYCSSECNLPVGQLARTVYGNNKEYHTSADNKKFVRLKKFKKTANEILNYIQDNEKQIFLRRRQPYCEIQLGKRGLYPNTNSPNTWKDSSDNILNSRDQLNITTTILSAADGLTTLSNVNFDKKYAYKDIKRVYAKLRKKGLLY